MYLNREITKNQMKAELSKPNVININKFIDLNQPINDDELQEMYIDHNLGQKLLMQDEKYENHAILNFDG